MDFTFGSDPEFMLVHGGLHVSAIGIIAANKNCRISQKGHEFYYDNVLAECAIKPSKTKEETLNNFRECFKCYANIVKPYQLVPQASHEYHPSQMLHRDAREVGCKTEYCAYLLQEVKDVNIVNVIKQSNFRSAGGHIHIGHPLLYDSFNQAFMVRMLDLFLGIPLIVIDKDNTAKARRRLYGRAGRHRKPSHGLEYRTPSNYWLSSPTLVSLVYDLCEFVLEFISNKKHMDFWKISEDVYDRQDYWNAHHCTGYNVQELRATIDNSNYKLIPHFRYFINRHLPVQLVNKISLAEARMKSDFYKEWEI